MSKAVELLRALDVCIEADRGTNGHPSGQAAKKRARHVAEKEAIRHLLSTDSFPRALDVGMEAYSREMRYFNPLTLVRERNREESMQVPD